MSDAFDTLTRELIGVQHATESLMRRVDTLIEQERRDLIELRKQVDLLRADVDALHEPEAA